MNDMGQNAKTRDLLLRQCQTYPDLQIQDIFKFLYQSSFGCEHLVSSCEKVTQYIREEYNRVRTLNHPATEPLDGDYSRVSLSHLDQGMAPETLGKIFFLSAKKEADGEKLLREKIDVVKEMAREKSFSFTSEEFEKEAAIWEANGFPAVRHSDVFRSKYSPSYRVIANKYIPFLPLFIEIDKHLRKGRVRVAIEGGSASGKTTLSGMLYEIYGCTVFHTDDFFLRPEQRTAERYAETGGNFDRERFLEEVLIPLGNNDIISYRRFDCTEMKLQPTTEVRPGKLTIVEGAYSMHPELTGFYDFSVFLDIPSDLQKKRIIKRNSPQMAERFFNDWIPLEKTYFEATQVEKRCDMCISICF